MRHLPLIATTLSLVLITLTGCPQPPPTVVFSPGDVNIDNTENNYYGDDDDSANEDITPEPVNDDDSAGIEECEYELVVSEELGVTACSGPMETVFSVEELYNGDILQTNISEDQSWIYYFYNGERFTMPHGSVFESWYGEDACPACETMMISDPVLTASLPLVGNMTMKPGSYIVVIGSDSSLFLIDQCRTLRPTTPGIAQEIYGNDWNNLIRLIPDWFFVDYNIGDHVASASEFDPESFENVLPEDEFNCFPEETPTLTISTAGGLGDMSIVSNMQLDSITIGFTATGGEVIIEDPAFILDGLFSAVPSAFSDIHLRDTNGYLVPISETYNSVLGPIEYRFDTIVIPNGTTVQFNLDITVPETTSLQPGDNFFASFSPWASSVTNASGNPIPTDRIVIQDDLYGATFTVINAAYGLTWSQASSSPGGAAIPWAGLNVLDLNGSAAAMYGNQPVNEMIFQVISTDNAYTMWNTCEAFTTQGSDAFELVDYSGFVSYGYEVYSASGAPCWSDPYGVVSTVLVYLSGEEIAAGTTTTYEVFFSAEGAASAQDDMLRVNLIGVNGNIPNPYEVEGLTLIF